MSEVQNDHKITSKSKQFKHLLDMQNSFAEQAKVEMRSSWTRKIIELAGERRKHGKKWQK